MEFKVRRKENPHVRKYSQRDLDTAREFAKRVNKEFSMFVRTVVLFGSAARKQKGGTDIDILVVIDDLGMMLTPEAVQTYRVIMQKIVGFTDKRIHLTTLKLTHFWDLVRTGDPVAINILRDGVAIIDTGLFDPLQALLYQGRIRPTHESIYVYLNRAPTTIANSKWHLLQASVDLYWAVVDAAHAALMKHGQIPPSPDHVADLLDEKLVSKGLLEKRYSTIMRNFYGLSKRVLDRDIREVAGRSYDRYLRDATDFVERMERLIGK
jgi:predicted nucleotidyltransferase